MTAAVKYPPTYDPAISLATSAHIAATMICSDLAEAKLMAYYTAEPERIEQTLGELQELADLFGDAATILEELENASIIRRINSVCPICGQWVSYADDAIHPAGAHVACAYPEGSQHDPLSA